MVLWEMKIAYIWWNETCFTWLEEPWENHTCAFLVHGFDWFIKKQWATLEKNLKCQVVAGHLVSGHGTRWWVRVGEMSCA